MKKILGIDIGGSGIKGAIVDISSGELVSDRIRIPTPTASTPANVVEVLSYILERLDYDGPIGIGFPGPVQNGVITRAINLSQEWDNFDARYFISSSLERKIFMLNDADAAALAEYRFGSWPKQSEAVIFLTVGTGIGSSLWIRNQFIPNTELGHLRMRKNVKFEDYASNKTRKEREMSWKKWGARFNKVLKLLDFYFTGPAFIIGGGIANKKERYEAYIDDNIKWDVAQLRNDAGIIGAALSAANA